MTTLSSPAARPAPVAHLLVDAASDERLMERVQGGDARAYEALVTRHRSAVAAVARGACGPDLADDVAQVALLAAWQHSASYRAERGTPRAWLLGIVRNRGIDQIRSHASRQRHTAALDPHGFIGIVDTSEAGEPAHEQLERAELQAAVRRLLADLPRPQREVLELAYFRGLTHTQIAERLGVPAGTVKGRLRLGIAKLRRGWDAGGAEPRELLAA
jgi:RNA polymerase sigma-70 factor (ECF subfamily)